MALWHENPYYKEQLTIGHNASSNEIKKYLENLHKRMLLNSSEFRKYIDDTNSQNNSEAINSEQQIQIARLVRTLELLKNFETVIEAADAFQTVVISKWLLQWQKEQVLAGNGGQLHLHALNEIQSWFEKLCNIVMGTRSSIEEVHRHMRYFPLNYDHTFKTAYNKAIKSLERLIVSGFILEKQPPQVIQTNNRFSATVRHLITNLSIEEPSVKVSILSESQAKAQQHSGKCLSETSGEITIDKSNKQKSDANKWILVPSRGTLVCNLSKMNLKKIIRSEKKKVDSVTDEKFTLLFQSSFRIGDLLLSVWAMSVPVVVIVHSSQESQALATITWDNAFSEICRVPFHVVDKVHWSQMEIALNMKFSDETGSKLSLENLNYLRRKVKNENLNDPQITWSQLSKQVLPQQSFTFWDWFYAAMKLIRDRLRGPWCENLIIGFIDKKEAEGMLRQSKPGTFLLRFSDSVLGGISIAYVENGNNVVMVQPLISKDFEIRSLGDRLNDLQQCKFLYPNIPKDQVFRNYYSPPNEIKDSRGYVMSYLKMTVPVSSPITPQHDNWQSCSNESSPITPQHGNSQSHMHPTYGSSVPSMVPNFDANDGRPENKRQRFV